MESIKQARELIQTLGKTMGLGDIDFDADGAVSFPQ
jgi:hypothetical protein